MAQTELETDLKDRKPFIRIRDFCQGRNFRRENSRSKGIEMEKQGTFWRSEAVHLGQVT